MRYRIDRAEIAYLSSLLESYEDLGSIRTVDAVAAIVEVLYAPDAHHTILALMASLAEDIPSLERVEPATGSADSTG